MTGERSTTDSGRLTRRDIVRLAAAAPAVGWAVSETTVTGSADADVVENRAGYLGTYYNLPESHPDVENPLRGNPQANQGLVRETLPLELTEKGRDRYEQFDWYDERYRSLRRVDEAIDFGGRNFLPLDEGKAGDPYHFAVHWRGTLTAPADDTYSLETTSDDESWVFVDERLVVDNGGLHGTNTVSVETDLTAGDHRVDVFYAERHTSGATMVFTPDDRLTARSPVEDVVEFRTGYDEAAETTLSLEEPDDDWTVTRDGRLDPPNAVPHEAFVAEDGNWPTFDGTRWVSADRNAGTGNLPESDTAFEYTTTFSLPTDLETPIMDLRARGDDRINAVLLNGRPLSFAGDGAFNGDPIDETYSDPSLFEDGENELTVVVEDTEQVVTGLDLVGRISAGRPSLRVEGVDTTVFQSESSTVELELVNDTDSAVSGVDLDARVEQPGRAGEVAAVSQAVDDLAAVGVQSVADPPTSVEADSSATFDVELSVPDGTEGEYTLLVTGTTEEASIRDRVPITVESPLTVDGGTILPLSGKENPDQGAVIRNDGTAPVTGIELATETDSDRMSVVEIGEVPDELEPDENHEQRFVVEASPDAEGAYGLTVTVTGDGGVETRGTVELDTVKTVQVGVDFPTDAKAIEPGEETVEITFDLTANQLRPVTDVRLQPQFSELPGQWGRPIEQIDPDSNRYSEADGGEWSFGEGDPVWTVDRLDRAESRSPSVDIAVPDAPETGVYTLPTTVEGAIGVDEQQERVDTVETDLNLVERFLGTFFTTPDERLNPDQDFTVSSWVWFEDAPVQDPRVSIPLPPGFEHDVDRSSAERGEFREIGRDTTIAVWQAEGEVAAGESLELQFGLRTPSLSDAESFQETYKVTATLSGTTEERGRTTATGTGQVLMSQFALLLSNKERLAKRIDDITLTRNFGEWDTVRPALSGLSDAHSNGDDGVTEAAAEDALQRMWMGEAVSTRLLEVAGPAAADGNTLFETEDYNIARATAGPIVLSGIDAFLTVATLGLGAAIGRSGSLFAKGLAKLLSGAKSWIEEGINWIMRKFLGSVAGRTGRQLGDEADNVVSAKAQEEAVTNEGIVDGVGDTFNSVVDDVTRDFVTGIETNPSFYGDKGGRLGAGVDDALATLTESLNADAVASGLGGDRATALDAGSAGIDKIDFLASSTMGYVDTFDGPDLNAVGGAVADAINSLTSGDFVGAALGVLNTIKEVALSIFNAVTGGLVGAFIGNEGLEALILAHDITLEAIIDGVEPTYGAKLFTLTA